MSHTLKVTSTPPFPTLFFLFNSLCFSSLCLCILLSFILYNQEILCLRFYPNLHVYLTPLLQTLSISSLSFFSTLLGTTNDYVNFLVPFLSFNVSFSESKFTSIKFFFFQNGPVSPQGLSSDGNRYRHRLFLSDRPRGVGIREKPTLFGTSSH